MNGAFFGFNSCNFCADFGGPGDIPRPFPEVRREQPIQPERSVDYLECPVCGWILPFPPTIDNPYTLEKVVSLLNDDVAGPYPNLVTTRSVLELVWKYRETGYVDDVQ